MKHITQRGHAPWQWLTFVILAASLVAACNNNSAHTTTISKKPPANVGSAYAPICPGGTACALTGTALTYHAAKHATPKGTATIGDWEAPDTISPLFADQHIDFTLIHALYGSCVIAGADLKWMPDECTETPTQLNGDVSADGMSVKMKLIPALQWSDGQPLTAADFVFGWQTLVNPKTAAANVGGYGLITAVTAVDPQTVMATFKAAFGPFLSYLPFALPQHELGSIAPDQLSANTEVNFQPKATSGPYVVSNYSLNDHVTLTPNTHYTSDSFYGPFLKSITVQAYHDPQSMIDAFSGGTVTLAQDFQPADLAALRQVGSGKLSLSPAVGYEHVLYNQANKNLANAAVRQALGLAIDRCALVQKALGGACGTSVATTITAPDALDFDKTITNAGPDLVKAGSLLDGAGFKKNSSGVRLGTDGKPLHFTLVTTNDSARLTEANLLVAAWKTIGIAVTISAQPGQKVFADFSQQGLLASGQFDIALLAFVGSADPDFTYDLYHSSAIPSKTNPAGSNYAHIDDPQLDVALQIERGSVDFDARVTALHTAQQIVVAQQFYVTPLYIWPIITLQTTALHGVVPGPTPDTFDWNIADWWM